MKKEDFINKANKKHNNFYNYSLLSENVFSDDRVFIICPIHGEFQQKAKLHLYGSKCVKCVHDSYKTSYVLTNDEFIERANKIHNNFYDYSKTNYINNLSLITIICPIHGEFQQKPREHMQGKGCISCSHVNSNPENEISNFIINKLNITNIIKNDRKILNGKEKYMILVI